MLSTLILITRLGSSPGRYQGWLIFLMVNDVHALAILGGGTLRLCRWLLPHLLYGGNKFHIIDRFGWLFVTVWSFYLAFFKYNKWWFRYFWWLIRVFTIWFWATCLAHIICSIRWLSNLLIFIKAIIQIWTFANDDLTDLLLVATTI